MPMLSLSVSAAVVVFALATAFALSVVRARITGIRLRGRARLHGSEAPTASDAGAADPKKIVIFYSSIGHGHISASLAIQEEILRQDPTARVLLQDIRAFMHPVWRRIDERLYWFVANNLPECFESLFRSMQARGNRVPSLSLLPNDYPEEKVLAYLTSQTPNAILATHYGSAQVLGTLRDRGLLPSVKIGWLHTDFFEGYFPRISKRIDRTFLAHAELESRWLAAGVPADKVVTSGMPVRIPADSTGGRQISLTRLGLTPDIPTLLLTAGKEGACDYSAVVDSVSRHCQGPVQIVAVCGTNARQQTLLTALQERLPPLVTLKVHGLLPQPEMVSYIRATDLLITKAGGMTPAEAFAMGTPTILLDVVSGHERENAAMFGRLGLAELATDMTQVGKIVADVLADPRRTEEMLSAQREFREGANITRIAQFALDESFIPARPLLDFGVENGTGALNIDEALARLADEAPADIELLLSYATSRSPQRIVVENPFGHLAIRIGGAVYSANHAAAREVDPNLLQHLSLADYLYGLQRPSRSQVHTSTYGMAYGRATLGLRVAGIPPRCTTNMVAEAQRIEEQFAQGALRYDKRDFNCGDVVVQILHAGGYCSHTLLERLRLPTMPLDVFEQARAVFEEENSLRVNLVAYQQVPGSQASYHFSRFPLSLGQPLRSIARMLADAPADPLEAAVMKQVTGYFGDRRLCFESLQARCTTSGLDDPALFGQAQLSPEQAIVADLRRLLALNTRRPIKELERLGDLYSSQEIRRLIDHGHDLARLATERTEEILLYPHAHRLRTLFTQLVGDYGRIGTRRVGARQIKAYMKRLQAFATAATREFSDLDVSRTKLASAMWRSVRRSVGRQHR
jgi:UDP-N-acetylglucosamine:LPS N-acetylglucosamine transferase